MSRLYLFIQKPGENYWEPGKFMKNCETLEKGKQVLNSVPSQTLLYSDIFLNSDEVLSQTFNPWTLATAEDSSKLFKQQANSLGV